jgi:hypothetical protein
MKSLKSIVIILSIGCFSFTLVQAQEQEAQQLLLNVEKLAQLKSILAKMKQGFQIISQGYDRIKSLSQGNFNLHKTFLDNLLKVNPAVRNYQKVAGVLSTQQSILKEYQLSKSSLVNNPQFSVAEQQYLTSVQNNLLQVSLKQLEEFAMIITSGQLRMSDAERLAAVDRIYAGMQDKLSFLRHFNNSNRLLAAGRKMQQYDVDNSRKLQGINH